MVVVASVYKVPNSVPVLLLTVTPLLIRPTTAESSQLHQMCPDVYRLGVDIPLKSITKLE